MESTIMGVYIYICGHCYKDPLFHSELTKGREKES